MHRGADISSFPSDRLRVIFFSVSLHASWSVDERLGATSDTLPKCMSPMGDTMRVQIRDAEKHII